ncbi:hypothetical protein A3E39_00635 [Candidatus Uhrbacteria bacterium RIFCSPHIGHO2_12_FULL_60_25]|uniref:O-antigen ligase-related domain-containing protein n=1 Tax=Candidatus Uhrbacteria bacterium RIFCSPHIGHO2_12_FULL_60_25 TaxID=1802399 RepID=A0A1F7UMV3_9BACT|nr:MAG: hypothetical protein A3D73_01705 [Candidatus Uhrbacteria bacterium RIFCSPHIGHO2_02_FULL_60_44]OGL79616.1 MAG: hypothetical protein A3E39_00635 [Candidatus Uhrbacteria bacterium RIFCSPHIGHO2_12_FULL_60_25]
MTRVRLFDVAWRLAILALPWQTRWIYQQGMIGGSLWEQGTGATYLSWSFVLIAVFLSFLVARLQNREPGTWNREPLQKGGLRFPVPRSRFPIALLVLLIVSFFTASPTATSLWWLHVAILTLFAWTLVRAHVDVTPWFILSLVPHAALGVWQYAAQDITGSTLLGIATQHPWTSGVSVVEHGLYRVLRAYGGFPHPNILGGWLAVGLTLLPGLARRSRSNPETLGLAACAVLFATALVLTFSRGAWIAAIVGLILAAWSVVRTSHADQDRQATWLVLAATVVAVAAGLASQWDHVTARFTPTLRLERWSIEQRSYAVEEGWDAFLARPIVGWGPGSSLVAITTTRQAKFSSRLTVPPEPPHYVPLVALIETGIAGVLAMAYLAWRLLRPALGRDRWRTSLPLLSVLGLLMLTDHYLWTLWAGQALVMLVVAMLITHVSMSERPSIVSS